MIRNRHPEDSHMIVIVLENHLHTPNLETVVRCKLQFHVLLGLNSQIGGPWPMVCDPNQENPRSTSFGAGAKAGNMKFQCHAHGTSGEANHAHHDSHRKGLLRLQSGPRVGVAFSATPSNFHLRTESQLSSADFVSVCFHAPVSAGVAVPLPCLATIAQFARGLESLGGEGLLLEVPVPASAEKLVAKLRPTSWCVTWTSQHPIHVMVAGWRSWLMDYPKLEESKLPWTPHWCSYSFVTGVQRQEDHLHAGLG